MSTPTELEFLELLNKMNHRVALELNDPDPEESARFANRMCALMDQIVIGGFQAVEIPACVLEIRDSLEMLHFIHTFTHFAFEVGREYERNLPPETSADDFGIDDLQHP